MTFVGTIDSSRDFFVPNMLHKDPTKSFQNLNWNSLESKKKTSSQLGAKYWINSKAEKHLAVIITTIIIHSRKC